MSERTIDIPLSQWNQMITQLNAIATSLNKDSKTDNVKVGTQTAAAASVSESKERARFPVHHYIYCDGDCHQAITESNNEIEEEPIRGDRYKCLECHNFDLCSICEENKVECGSHKSVHNMVKIKTPDSYHPVAVATPVSISEETQTTKSKTSSSNTDVILDISEKDKDLFEFFSKLTTVEKLRQVMNKVNEYDDLLNANQSFLTADNLAQKIIRRRRLSNDFKDLPKDGLFVDFFIKNKKDVMIFKILNNTEDLVIPSNCILNFNFKRNSTKKLVKCFLQMPKTRSLKPMESYKIQFNHVFEDGDFMNESEFFEVKILQRGKNSDDSKVLFEGTASSLSKSLLLTPSVEKRETVAADTQIEEQKPVVTEAKGNQQKVVFSPTVLSVEETLKKIDEGIRLQKLQQEQLEQLEQQEQQEQKEQQNEVENQIPVESADETVETIEDDLDDYDILSNSDLD